MYIYCLNVNKIAGMNFDMILIYPIIILGKKFEILLWVWTDALHGIGKKSLEWNRFNTRLSSVFVRKLGTRPQGDIRWSGRTITNLPLATIALYISLKPGKILKFWHFTQHKHKPRFTTALLPWENFLQPDTACVEKFSKYLMKYTAVNIRT